MKVRQLWIGRVSAAGHLVLCGLHTAPSPCCLVSHPAAHCRRVVSVPLGRAQLRADIAFPEWHHYRRVPRESLQLADRGGGCDIIYAYQSGPLPGHDRKDQSDPRHHVSKPPQLRILVGR